MRADRNQESSNAALTLHSEQTSVAFDAACHHLALVDRSRVGKLLIKGRDGVDLLHRLTTNDLARAGAGSVTPTLFVTEKGRLIDAAYLVQSSSLMLLVSEGNEHAVRAWIEKFTIMEDVTVEVCTDAYTLISMVGPEAYAVGENVFGYPMEAGRAWEGVLPHPIVTILCHTEFGVHFVDLLVPTVEAEKVREFLPVRLRQEISSQGIAWMDDQEYEAFRISHGIPRLGHEIADSFNPFEVGLHHALSLRKGCYIGQEVLARLDAYQKVQREPWGIVLDGAESLLPAGSIVVRDNSEIGAVTSVSEMVIRGKRMAIGILKKGLVCADDLVGIEGGGRTVIGRCTKFPIVV